MACGRKSNPRRINASYAISTSAPELPSVASPSERLPHPARVSGRLRPNDHPSAGRPITHRHPLYTDSRQNRRHRNQHREPVRWTFLIVVGKSRATIAIRLAPIDSRMAHVLTLHHVDHVFGDIRRVIPDALQVFRH